MADNALTARELEVLAKAWGCMRSQPDIDYDKLAEACGMGNPRSASNAWAKIRKKLSEGASAEMTTPKVKGKKRVATSEVEDTPTKKKSTKKAKKAAPAPTESEAEAGDEEDEIVVKQELVGNQEKDLDIVSESEIGDFV